MNHFSTSANCKNNTTTKSESTIKGADTAANSQAKAMNVFRAKHSPIWHLYEDCPIVSHRGHPMNFNNIIRRDILPETLLKSELCRPCRQRLREAEAREGG